MQSDHDSTGFFQRFADQLAKLAIGIAAVALLGLVLVQGWQVIARYLLNDSPSWTEPVTLLLLSTAMSLGAATGVHTHRHFSFSLLADALPPRLRHVMQILQALVIMVIGLVLAYWGSILFLDGLHIPVAGASLPDSIEYLPLAISGALMALFAVLWMKPSAPTAMEQGD
jgi:TRAP-type C4-dicarboxylate transport system permease small subunit